MSSSKAPHAFEDISSSFSRSRKYKGLLNKSVWKAVRNSCWQFMDYSYTLSSDHVFPVFFCQSLLLFQFLVSSFLSLDPGLWDRLSVVGRLLNVASVTVFIAPCSLEIWRQM
jgi:hypothetical protein